MDMDDVAETQESRCVHKGAEGAQLEEQKQSGRASPDEQHNLSQGSRRRIYADPPTLEQQLADAQAALKRMSDEHAEALQQAQTEAEERAVAAAVSTHRIEEWVNWLQQTHEDHVARVSDPQGCGAERGDTAEALEQIANLQAQLPAPPGETHFYAVSQSMKEQWTLDLELLETALRDPFAPSPYLVSDQQAQSVVDHLRAMWTELEEAPPEGLPPMQMLLLSKRLRCIDQLRPADVEEEGQPAISWQVLELGALLAQVTAHRVMWSYVLRWPCRFFESAGQQVVTIAANKYARAAVAAAPDVAQQARLLVEQCKSLERIDQLHQAQHLDAVALEYPEAPLHVLHSLHTQYAPAPGPPPDRDMLRLLEERSGWSEDDWADECAVLEQHAAELEEQLQLDEIAGVLRKRDLKKQRRRAEQARNKADTLAAHPHSFSAAMNKSLLFFHPDKRAAHAAEGIDTNAEFAQLQEAWKQLDTCRIHFEQLREFQEQMPAAMEQ